jgi:uncharacterized membrane protein YuzA (DUF378 family)
MSFKRSVKLLLPNWPALASFVLPVAFALVLLDATMRFLLPPLDHWPKFSAFLAAGLDANVADIQGRMSFSVTSAYVRIIALGAVVIGYVVAKRRFGNKIAILAMVAATILGGITGKYVAENDLLLVNVVYQILNALEVGKIVAPETLGRTQATVIVNMVVGVAGVFCLLTAFSILAIRARTNELSPDRLRIRVNDLQLVTLCGSLLLIFLVIVGKAIVAWPHGLIAEVGSKGFGQLAGGAVNSWGASGTAMLLCALLPAFFTIKADVERAASRQNAHGPAARQEWIQQNKLEFTSMPAIGTAIVSAAPMLTGPAIDIVGSMMR